ncbi:Rieske (2Fe-2S) protein [Frankia sp. AgPm24]|uniref:Rieske (2Fe-2S) protein n=1 Tax=Frankia sp. AgPm24 TaxID=631128 RepID=UPI00201008A5|nr:Rieske (2Fe-2S) protein [Frankia sp. AgPm24]MCK9925426.1 Rieske (2Fe-2S) protein [Frankia sp. AgPm24]
MTRRAKHRFIEDLLHGRRPHPFAATSQDAAELRAAIALRAAAPDATAPSPDFLADLHRRLAATLDATADATDTPPPAVPSPIGSPPAGPPPVGTLAAVQSDAVRPDAGQLGDDELASRRGGTGTRRRFVGGASIAAAAATVGGAVGAVVQRTFAPTDTEPRPSAETSTLMPATAVWATVATTQDLPEGGVRAFDLGTVSGFVRRSAGQVRAVSGVCTHQGCQLALDAAESRLNCPCHRTSFAISGEVLHSQLRTPPRTLPEFRVREVSGVVQVYAPPRPV